MKILYIALLAVTMLAVFASGQVGEGRNIVITLINQEPDPVEPGGYATLRFKVENWGSENAQDMTVELIPEPPLTKEGTISQFVGSVWGRQKGDLGATAKFRVKIDGNAAVGTSGINARYRLGSGDWVTVGPFNISIKSPKAVLAIREVKMPESIGPGQKANLTLYLQNTAKSTVRNVAVKLDLSSSTGFAPVGFNERVIETIGPGEIKEATFAIVALPDSSAGAYRIPVAITYTDELNAEYSRNGTIGALIGSAAEIEVQLESSSTYTQNLPGEVSLKFINKGLTGIKFFSVRLAESEDYEIISSPSFYIGEIDPDDYETAEFRLYPKKESATLLLEMEYRDSGNSHYSEQRRIPLKLYTGPEAERLGLKKGGSSGLIVMLLIVAGGLGLFFFFRRKR